VKTVAPFLLSHRLDGVKIRNGNYNMAKRAKREGEGRPSKKDQPTGETVSGKFLSAVRLGLSEKTASDFAGISERTINNWKKQDSFCSAINNARAEAKVWWCVQLRQSAVVASGRGNCTPMMFWLSRRSDEFEEQNREPLLPPRPLIIDNAD
jgi:hypothetical protein